MKKSNIILLVSFILLIGALIISRDTLLRRYENGKVTIDRTKRPLGTGRWDTQHEILMPASKYVVFTNEDAGYGDFSIIDSVVTDQHLDTVLKIMFKTRHEEDFDQGKTFLRKGDTLFVDIRELADAQLYMTGLQTFIARTESTNNIRVSEFIQDSLTIIGRGNSAISIGECRIRYCRFEISSGASVTSSLNHIDSLSVHVDSYGLLFLSDFNGEIVSSFFDYSSRVELTGSSLRALSRIKWND